MHLAYLDDSEQTDSLAMFGAMVIPHRTGFGYEEQLHSAVIQQLFRSEDVEEKFKVFPPALSDNCFGRFSGAKELTLPCHVSHMLQESRRRFALQSFM